MVHVYANPHLQTNRRQIGQIRYQSPQNGGQAVQRSKECFIRPEFINYPSKKQVFLNTYTVKNRKYRLFGAARFSSFFLAAALLAPALLAPAPARAIVTLWGE